MSETLYTFHTASPMARLVLEEAGLGREFHFLG